MKVVFATGIFPPDIGGPATYVKGMAQALLSNGTAVEVVTYGADRQPCDPFPVERVSRDRPLPLRYTAFFLRVRDSLSRDGVVYLQDPVSSGLPGILAASSKRRPSVLKVVGDLAWEIGREMHLLDDEIDVFQMKNYSALIMALKWAERFVAKRATRIITPSRYLKELVMGWDIPAEKIDVVYNSTVPAEGNALSKEEARSSLGVDGDPLLFSAGRLAPWKGFDTLIDAMPDILGRRPNARLLIAGSGPEEESLTDQIQKANLDGRVILVGPLDRRSLARHLSASDVFVLASTYEGFSHVLLEAMHAGLPVVASRVGGNPELVDEGESGLLVNPRAEDVAVAVHRLAADVELRQRLSRNAPRRASSFRWEDMVSKTRDILSSLVE